MSANLLLLTTSAVLLAGKLLRVRFRIKSSSVMTLRLRPSNLVTSKLMRIDSKSTRLIKAQANA